MSGIVGTSGLFDIIHRNNFENISSLWKNYLPEEKFRSKHSGSKNILGPGEFGVEIWVCSRVLTFFGPKNAFLACLEVAEKFVVVWYTVAIW